MFNLSLSVCVRLYLFAITASSLLLSCCPNALKPIFLSYGKLASPAAAPASTPSKKSYPTRALEHLNITVPKRFFSHFYKLAVLVCLGLVLLHLYLWNDAEVGGNARKFLAPSTYLAFALFFIHVARRFYETTLDGRSNASAARMHVAHYFLGLSYYAFAPLALVAEDLEGSRDEPSLKPSVEYVAGAGWYAFYLCACLFTYVIGSVHQWRCHAILRTLKSSKSPVMNEKQNGAEARKEGDVEDGHRLEDILRRAILKKESVSTTKKDTIASSYYAIPYGDWFAYVSAPHYLSEIFIYCGIVMLCQTTGHCALFGDQDHVRPFFAPNITAIFLLVWVVTTLTTIAMDNQRWYERRFEERYPKERRAIIPFVL